jgi:hypothetical protein
VILGLGVWFTQEKTPSKPLAFGKRQRRRASTFKRNGATTVPAPFPAKILQNRHVFVDATFHICNLARHVHKAQRHMAIFSSFTITQQLSMVRCFGIFDSASRR